MTVQDATRSSWAAKDRILPQSAVIIAYSTGESGVAGRELLANQIIRNEGVVTMRKKILLSWLSAEQVSWYYNRYKGTYYNSRNAELYKIAGFSINKKYRRCCGLCGSANISQLSALSLTLAYAVYHSSALQCVLGEKLVSGQWYCDQQKLWFR